MMEKVGVRQGFVGTTSLGMTLGCRRLECTRDGLALELFFPNWGLFKATIVSQDNNILKTAIFKQSLLAR